MRPSHILWRLRGAARLVTGFVGGREHDRDLDDELRFHLDKATERNIRRGMSPDDARRAALVVFGGRRRWTESARDERRSRVIDDFWRDLRYGAATLRRNPSFASSAILTIAVGIAAIVTVFSFINSIYLRPLAVPEGRRIMRIAGGDRPDLDQRLGFPAYQLLRRSAKSFDMVAAHYSYAPLYLTSRNESAEVTGAVVSADYFRMLGIRPALGRFFDADEDSIPDRDAVAVIGYGLWQSRFGGDEGVVGQTVAINGRTFTIVGVAPRGFDGVVAGWSNDLWIPTMMLRTGYRWCDGFAASCPITSVIARLARGSTAAQARAEISALTPALVTLTRSADSIHSITVAPAAGVPESQQIEFARLTTLLSAIALILLAVACANSSSLLLARGLVRQREIALRTSLGAGRWRIIRQLLAESTIVAGAGGMLGVLLSLAASRALVGFFATDSEGYVHPYHIPLDARVLAFAVGTALVAVVLFGLFPALRVSRVDVAAILKAGSGGGNSGRRARAALVTAQVTLALTLLIGAGLLTRSFSIVMTGRPFDPRHIANLRLRPRLVGYTHERAEAYLRRALAAIRDVPGVVFAVPVNGSLVSQVTGRVTVGLPNDVPAAKDHALSVDYLDVGPGYFSTLRVPVLAGREFTERDNAASPLVALVDESLAKRLWPAGDVIGRPLLLSGKRFQVVGVVKDHRAHTVEHAAPATVYVAFWQSAFEPQFDARIAVRVEGDPLRALPMLRRAVVTADAAVPVTETLGMESQLRATFTEVRLGGSVLVVSAALALFLSAVGLYGVVSFLVTQRAKEIGIRMAVGAKPADVVRMFLRQGLRPVWVGGVIGLVISIAGAPLLSRWLFGVAPFDLPTIVVALGGVGVVGYVASYVPARRAARANPALVFRGD